MYHPIQVRGNDEKTQTLLTLGAKMTDRRLVLRLHRHLSAACKQDCTSATDYLFLGQFFAPYTGIKKDAHNTGSTYFEAVPSSGVDGA